LWRSHFERASLNIMESHSRIYCSPSFWTNFSYCWNKFTDFRANYSRVPANALSRAWRLYPVYFEYYDAGSKLYRSICSSSSSADSSGSDSNSTCDPFLYDKRWNFCLCSARFYSHFSRSKYP